MRLTPLMLAGSYAAAVFVRIDNHDRLGFARLFFAYFGASFSLTLLILLVKLFAALRREPHGGLPRSLAGIVVDAVLARWRRDCCTSLWLPLTAFALLMAAFTTFKQRLLPGAGFAFGPSAATIDHWMLGRDAWRVTHAMLPGAGWSQFIDLAYHAWFAPMTLGVVLCAFARPGSLLAWRYLMTYLLTWVVQGSMIARLLPAAGPCFFQYFQVERERFLPLVAELRMHDATLMAAGWPGLSAPNFQEQLLKLYGGAELAVGGGISAMPSLHNAMAVLFACAGFHFGRRIGGLLSAYAALIWIGSIHLGWHYAIDGVVALVVTMFLWKLTGAAGHRLARGADEQEFGIEPQLGVSMVGTQD